VEDALLEAPRPWRILVADDDAAMRQVLADSLRKDGYEIVEAKDGAELLVRITRMLGGASPADEIDLIVTDVRMPTCGGLDVVKGLRDATSKIPVVVMSAFGGPHTRSRAAALGAVFLDKPFRMGVLRSTVRDLLGATSLVR
jgi:CheY-like chemotaxis protein